MSEPEPMPSEMLADYIETDSHGFKSFNYAGQTGALLAVLDRVRETLDAMQRMSAKDRPEQARDIKRYVDHWHDRNRRLHSEWCDFYPRHIEWRKNQRLAEIGEHGGPTVQDPDRPYCKPDQSCCDFVCGN